MTIAFGMECFENGLITPKDTEGIDLSFGNAEAMIQTIERIALRKGFGDYLAEGVKRAAEKLGGEAKKYALHIKGQEVPLHEVRGKFGVGLGYAVSPTGADHLEAPHETPFQQPGPVLSSLAPLGILEPISPLDSGPEKVAFFRHTQLLFNLWNCLGICNFAVTPQGALSVGNVVNLVKCVTGWDTSLYELLRVSDRMLTMARMFNLREGFGREDDTWPERFLEPLPDGPHKGQTFTRDDLEQAKDLYYEMMGWDKVNGKPTKAKLAELNLEWLMK
jgi:aldehyde:ferredoxin oxidoreductase